MKDGEELRSYGARELYLYRHLTKSDGKPQTESSRVGVEGLMVEEGE